MYVNNNLHTGTATSMRSNSCNGSNPRFDAADYWLKRPYLHPVYQQPRDTPHSGAAGSSGSSSGGGSGESNGSLQGSSHNASGQHLLQPDNPEVAASRQAVQQFLSSPEFAAEHERMQQQQPSRGILVSAGGKGLTTQLVVLLKVR